MLCQCSKIFWPGSLVDVLREQWILRKAETISMQGLAGVSRARRRPIPFFTHQRMTEMRQVDTDLVGASGKQAGAEEAVAIASIKHLEFGAGVLT